MSGAEEMNQWIGMLAPQRRYLSSNPPYSCKKPGLVIHTLTAGVAETKGRMKDF